MRACAVGSTRPLAALAGNVAATVILAAVLVVIAAPSAAQDLTAWTVEGIRVQSSDLGQAPSSNSGAADATAAELPDGRVRLYFGASDGVRSAISTDGLAFSVETGVRLPPGAAHPRVVRLDDGRWRLFYGSASGISSAISTDGLTFTVEPGLRIAASEAGMSRTGGGTVVRLPDGTHRMYWSDLPIPGTGQVAHRVLSARSADMLAWTIEPGVRLGDGSGVNRSAEHPFALVNGDGSVTMFFFENTDPITGAFIARLSVATSADGLTFTAPSATNLAGPTDNGNDPDLVRLSDGRLRMYFGRHSETTGNSIWSAIGGAPGTARVSVPTTTTSFGVTVPSAPVDRTITVRNTGSATLTGTATAAPPFSVTSGASLGIAVGGSQTVRVRFTPSTTGTFAGNVTIDSNGGAASVPLSGTGVTSLPAAQLTVSGTQFRPAQQLTFGVTAQNPVGSLAADLYVGAILPGGTVLTFSSPGVLGAAAALASPARLVPFASVSSSWAFSQPSFFQFTFPASGVPAGAYSLFAAWLMPGALTDNRLDPGDILAVDMKSFTFAP